MKSSKIVPIKDLWKRAQKESAATGADDKSMNWPTFESDEVSEGNKVEQEPETDKSKPEVRFEKIIEVKQRIKNDYYKGDQVGMDILRSIFADDLHGDDAPSEPQSDGDRNDVSDS